MLEYRTLHPQQRLGAAHAYLACKVDDLERAGADVILCISNTMQEADGAILGCTEIFLLIGQNDLLGFPVFNTTALHVEAAVRFSLRADEIVPR